VIRRLEKVFQQTPLDIVAEILLRYPHLEAAAENIFNSYDAFLGMVSDDSQRLHLETLAEDKAETDATYQRARALSHSFRDGLCLFLRF
jgi:hypothetical protein